MIQATNPLKSSLRPNLEVLSPIRFDLGCGNNKKEGFLGIDVTKEGTQADLAFNLLEFPWPIEAGSVDEFFSSHHFEHVPQMLRGKFMEEAYRCLKFGGTFKLITPYAWSRRAVQDFTHQWPPIVPESYLYFNEEWRKINGLTHWEYDLKCNFNIENCQYSIADKFKGDNEVLFKVEHNINVCEDMIMTLRKV